MPLWEKALASPHVKSAADGLEPAERNPAQLRKTALILVGVILVGAIAVTVSYIETAKKQNADFRPAFANELKGHVKLQLSDGTIKDTSDIKEDVWLYYQTSFDERDSHETRDKALALLPKEGIKQVEFFVDMDPNNDEDRAKMATLPSEPGIWKVSAKAKVLEKYLKTGLRFGTIPHMKDGKLIYDSSVALLKRDYPEGKNPRIHIRGELFDFKKAEEEALTHNEPEAAKGYREDWFLRDHILFLLNEGDPTNKK